MDKFSIETPRLLLRDYETADTETFSQYVADPQFRRYLTWNLSSRESVDRFIAKTRQARTASPRLAYDLAATLKETGELIGGGDLIRNSEQDGDAWTGYYLKPEFWRQGYGTEIAQALLDFGFRELKLHRICALCDPRNVGSWRILEKLGMRREGLMKEHVRVQEEWRDSYLYAMLQHEWPSVKRS